MSGEGLALLQRAGNSQTVGLLLTERPAMPRSPRWQVDAVLV